VATSCRCLITDDHPIVRKGVRDILVQEGVCSNVVEAGNGRSTIELIQRQDWDLLILDISLPDKHGLEVLKEVKQLRPKLPVLMLSLYPEREFAMRALKTGASGYLTKDQAPIELLIAVKEVMAGRRYITASLANQLAAYLGTGRPATSHDLLSNREMEVLRLLGKGKSVSMIAAEIALSVKTVSTYRARLLEKLHLMSTADLIRYAIEHRLAT
jgi:two-component system, NarL family, invasion response regulator UvrY